MGLGLTDEAAGPRLKIVMWSVAVSRDSLPSASFSSFLRSLLLAFHPDCHGAQQENAEITSCLVSL